MFMEKDYLMRQIQTVALMIARTMLGKTNAEYHLDYQLEERELDQDSLDLRQQLMALIDQNRPGTAEDLLFANLDPDDKNMLALAVDFYQKLNQRTDGELEAIGFPREEIESGLHDVMQVYGVSLPEI